MKLLVTGGAGFIGSEFVRAALGDRLPGLSGAAVTVVDRLTYSGNRANLAPVAGDSRFRFVHGDICDAGTLADAVPGHDAIVHFAAETHVDRSLVGAERFVRTNVLGTQALLDAAQRHGVGRFLHVSTDEVYGSIVEGSWVETAPIAPTMPYAATKAAADLLALAHHRVHGLDVVVTRCTNNYGPYQFPEKMIPLFVTNLLDGRRVPLYGDGRNVRDWLHVFDHCRALALVLRSGRAGEVYHVGGGTELTNVELTERLLAACGAGWDSVDNVPDRRAHDLRYSLDITKIRTELGYEPSVGIVAGLAETVAWYRDNRAWWEPLKPAADAGAGPRTGQLVAR
ncbi:dTDP-glucose 4,6-dehydratase [Phytohabitans suffuscus]|uniref:dTDP-glucose 4,6-dehydratase n=1 Tax=Phytohabitans suffuscus TaxID=624315 RepID=A0A6F8YR16_9ACTN|nr:dTDP-glucose 4,6-dehydratase [Phytohabitans suffuscus]BCB88499.1 dTDP-glucose 4,6-dehydratase [Phytohabitans suffuscus]